MVNKKNSENFEEYEDSETEYRKVEDEESSFYGESIAGEEILQDGTDYTDVVQEARNRRKTAVIILIVAAIAFVLGLGYFFKNIILDNEETPTAPTTPVATETIETVGEDPEPNYTEPNRPVAELMPEVSPTNGEITAFVDENKIQTSDGSTLTLNNSTITPTVHECKTKQATDFCDIAEIKVGPEGSTKTYYSYFLKDAVNSRFFEAPEEFSAVEVTGAPGAAIVSITTLDGNPTHALVVLQNNSSGFMFISAENNPEDLKTLMAEINAA